MWDDGGPDQWSRGTQYAVSAVLGVLWSFLWVGLPRQGAYLFIFPLLSALLIGPTLGAVSGPSWRTLGGRLGVAFVVSGVASLALSSKVDLFVPTGQAAWSLYLVYFALSWLPAAAVASWMMVRRRRETPPTT